MKARVETLHSKEPREASQLNSREPQRSVTKKPVGETPIHDPQNYDITAKEPQTGDVIVWFDSSDLAQHACAVIAPGLVLNKDAQRWSAPRQILKLESVLEHWAETQLEVRVFSNRLS